MIWSMAQSDAYKHGALSVILQSGQQRLLGVSLCHSDPTQTHRTLPDLLSLDINRCLFFGGVSEQQLWRGIDHYTVYTPSLVLPRLRAAINACTSLCVAHTVQILKQMSQDRLSRTTHSHLTQLLPIVGWWGNDVSVWLTKKVLIGYILCRMCMIFPVILICIVTIKSGSTSVKALILFYDL